MNDETERLLEKLEETELARKLKNAPSVEIKLEKNELLYVIELIKEDLNE
jgi:hypothetical protein